MLKMIKYNLKSRYLLIIISTVICFAIAFTSLLNEDFLQRYYVGNNSYKIGPGSSPISMISVLACILCTIIPVIEFSFKMRKVNIDQMYSLPIKREKLYLAKFISGFIEILIPITITFVYCLLVVISNEHMFDLIYFLPYFGCLIVGMFILYSTITFAFTRTNTMLDGIINIFLYIFVFVLLIMELRFYTDIEDVLHFNSLYLYSPISSITSYFELKLREQGLNSIGKTSYYKMIDGWIEANIFLGVIGVASFILFIVLNKRDKAEDSMQISNSWFSYKTLIPIYTFITILFVIDENVSNFIFVFVGVYIAYVVFRRSLKIKKWDYIVFAIVFASTIIFHLIFEQDSSNIIYDDPNSFGWLLLL
ncbi:MAG: hypothetical protein IJX78_05745 [Bacilli bacterium]|nr:hypothetical protein [Bacilli bacterium]